MTKTKPHNKIGTMSWETIHEIDYLYLKKDGESRCLGVRSPNTEKIYLDFNKKKTLRYNI